MFILKCVLYVAPDTYWYVLFRERSQRGLFLVFFACGTKHTEAGSFESCGIDVCGSHSSSHTQLQHNPPRYPGQGVARTICDANRRGEKVHLRTSEEGQIRIRRCLSVAFSIALE